MTEQNFGTLFRLKRDGQMTPQDSWKFRHGHIFMGCTFHICALQAQGLEKLYRDDLQWLLLEAVSIPDSTDIQIHFKEECKQSRNLPNHLSTILNDLVASGFAPMSVTLKSNSSGTGWLRMALYSVEDLPSSPFGQIASA